MLAVDKVFCPGGELEGQGFLFLMIALCQSCLKVF
jgi:hypothetical protein